MLVQEDGAGDLVGCAEGLEHGERAVYFDYTKVSALICQPKLLLNRGFAGLNASRIAPIS